MVLTKQIIDIPIGGINESVDPKLLPLGSSAEAQNVEFSTNGAVNKRNGYTALPKTVSGGSNITAARSIHLRGEEILLVDGTRLLSYSSELDTWIKVSDYYPSKYSTSDTQPTNGGAALIFDAVSTDDVDIVAWVDENTSAHDFIWLQIKSRDTGATIYGPVAHKTITPDITGNISRVCLCVSGDYFYLTYTSDHYYVISKCFSLSDFSVVNTAEFIVSGSSSVGPIGARDIDGAGKIALAWYDETAGELSIQFQDETGMLGSPTTHSTTDMDSDNLRIGMATNAAGTIFVFWTDFDFVGPLHYGRVLVWTYNSSLTRTNTAVGTTSAVSESFGIYNETTDTLDIASTVGGPDSTVSIEKFDSSGAYSSISGSAGPGFPVCSPFIYGGVTFVILRTAVFTGQTTFFIVKPGESKVVSRFFYGEASSSAVNAPVVSVLSNNVFVVPVPVAYENKAGSSGSITDTISVVSCDFNYKPESITKNDTLFLSGSILMEYDGADLFENGFLLGGNLSTSQSSTGGSLADGTYNIKVVYTAYNTRGEKYISAPSAATTVTISYGTGTAKITVTPTSIAGLSDRNRIRAEVYITEPSGTIYYYSGLSLGPSSTVTITSVNTTGAQIYTSDGTLDYDAPEQLVSITSKGGRVFGITEKGDVWYSNEQVSGYGVSFSWFLTQKTHGGPTANYKIRNIEDIIAISGAPGLQLMTGNGPTAAGTNNDFAPPRGPAEAIAPNGANPALSYADGIIYKIGNRLFLLGRDFSYQHNFGEQVQDTTPSTVASMIAISNEPRVLIGFTDNDTACVYDYSSRQWSQYTGHQMQDAASSGDSLCWVTSAGQVYKRNSTYLDNATPIQMLVETPWIRVGSVQGYQRAFNALILGEWKSAHTLNMKIYYDYSSTAAETISFDLSSGYSPGDPLRLEHYCGRPCQAVKIRLYDSDTTGESVILNIVSLEIGAEQDAARLNPSWRA